MTKLVSLQTQTALEKFNSFMGIEKGDEVSPNVAEAVKKFENSISEKPGAELEKNTPQLQASQPVEGQLVEKEAAKFDLWKFLKQLFGFEEKDQSKKEDKVFILSEGLEGEKSGTEVKFEKIAPGLEENKGSEEEKKNQTQELSDADRKAITDAVRKAFEQGKSGEDVHKFLKENEIKGDIGAAFKKAIETVQMEMNKAAKEAQVAAKLEAEKESEEEKEGHTKEISAQENEKSQNAEKPTASLDAVIPGKESSGFNLSPEEEENLAAVAKLFGEEEVEFQETTKNVGENFKSDASKEVVNDQQQQQRQ